MVSSLGECFPAGTRVRKELYLRMRSLGSNVFMAPRSYTRAHSAINHELGAIPSYEVSRC